MKYGSRFEDLWGRVWRKDCKRMAYKAWCKLDEDEVEEVERVIDDHCQYYGQREPQYRPHVSTWLNQGRWEDELVDPLAKSPNQLLYEEQVKNFGYGDIRLLKGGGQ